MIVFKELFVQFSTTHETSFEPKYLSVVTVYLTDTNLAGVQRENLSKILIMLPPVFADHFLPF